MTIKEMTQLFSHLIAFERIYPCYWTNFVFYLDEFRATLILDRVTEENI
jgi:hypothetical protein